MIGKILAVGAVSAALITVADKYNLLGINPNQKMVVGKTSLRSSTDCQDAALHPAARSTATAIRCRWIFSKRGHKRRHGEVQVRLSFEWIIADFVKSHSVGAGSSKRMNIFARIMRIALAKFTRWIWYTGDGKNRLGV